MNKKPTFTTAIEWHDPKTDPPKESRESIRDWPLIVDKNGYISRVPYSKRHNRFNFYDYNDPSELDDYDVLFWAEIPEQFTWDALAPYREGDGA